MVRQAEAIFNLSFTLKGRDFGFPTLSNQCNFAQSLNMKKLIALLALAACTSTPALQTNTPVGDRLPTGMDDTCGAKRYHTLLDQDATALERILILGQVRIVRPGTILTQDYRPERMNFHVGDNGKVIKISCG